jgi:hypothetical protein
LTTRAVYTFTEKTSNKVADQIEFDLIDNPGVRAWQYAVMLNSANRTCKVKSPIVFLKNVPSDIDQQYQFLINVLDQLSGTDMAFAEKIPATFDLVDQALMNRLHRHFTNGCYSLWDHRSPNFENDNLDRLLWQLNEIIHKLELYLPTDHKIKYNNFGQEVWARSLGDEFGYDIFNFRDYHSYESADLILDAYILGKTLIESFACADDPTSWDTNGHMKTNGGAVMLLGDHRSQIYNSKEFETWLNQHGQEPNARFADFPLGHFVPGHKTKLEHVSKELHNYSVQLHIQL